MKCVLKYRLLTVYFAISGSLLFFGLPGNVSAELHVVSSLAKLRDTADLIVVVRIDKLSVQIVGERRCGNEYIAHVSESVKKNGEVLGQKKIKFGRFVGLKKGENYILFLKYMNNSQNRYPANESKDFYDILIQNDIPNEISGDSLEIQEFVECNGLVPGYMANPSGAWRVHGENIDVGQFLPVGWPSDVKYTRSADNTIQVNRTDLTRYLGLHKQ